MADLIAELNAAAITLGDDWTAELFRWAAEMVDPELEEEEAQ